LKTEAEVRDCCMKMLAVVKEGIAEGNQPPEQIIGMMMAFLWLLSDSNDPDTRHLINKLGLRRFSRSLEEMVTASDAAWSRLRASRQ